MFVDWLFGRNKFGATGEYAYGTAYIITVCVGVAILATLIGLGLSKKLNEKIKRRILLSIAWFGIVFEVLWRIIYLIRGGDNLASLYPYFPCNLAGILIPLAVLYNNDTMKKMFYVFGFLGGLLTYAFPQGIFCNELMSFPILKSVLQHSTILFIPAYEVACGTFKIRFSDFKYFMMGMGIHIVNSELISVALNHPGDYLFMGSGSPLQIPGIPTFISTSVLAMLVFVIVYAIGDYKNVWAWSKHAWATCKDKFSKKSDSDKTEK